MGSPPDEDGHRTWELQREVTLVGDFFIGSTPVTQEQYASVTGDHPTVHESIPDAPVDSVNWHRADAYCEKLTEIDRQAGRLPEAWHYRLPTETEWEYTCRAGNREAFHGEPQDVAWHCANAEDRPRPVGRKQPNVWGLHDMHGNIWEWCQDWFSAEMSLRSVRGGSYFNSARFCRSAQRWGWHPKNRGRYCGFRIVAARLDSFDLSPPIEDYPKEQRPPSIYNAIDADDFELARQVITADPAAVRPVDDIPPPLHNCIYADKPEMLEWLLDHGADKEQRDQDYGSTPLIAAVVMRRSRIIRTLIRRGADTSLAMDHAQRGLAGAFEDDPQLEREGYREIVELLRDMGVEA